MIKQKIIIFFPVGIGDSLMFTPIINFIKQNNKIIENYDIDALVMNPSTKEILENLIFFKKIYFIDFLKQSISYSIKDIFTIRKNNYDKSILIFPANLYKYQVIHFLLGAKERFSHEYITKSFIDLYWLSNKKIPENRKLHSTEENYHLIKKAFNLTDKLKKYKMSILIDDKSFKFADKFIFETNGDKNTEFIGIHTGSDTFKNLKHKRWNKDYFVKLTELIDNKYNNKFHFLLFGIGDELEINEYIKNKSSVDNITVVRNTTFLESSALISKCSFFISNDSGLMHTASALAIPVLSIFGPTNENYTKPLAGINIVSTLKNCNCRPCFEYSKFSLVCNEEKKYRCMNELTPNIVFKDFNNLNNLYKQQRNNIK